MRQQFMNVIHQYWLHHTLFTWQWWFLLIIAVVPWFVWTRLADKTRLLELMAYGLVISIICVLLDAMGTNLLLWGYPVHLFWFLLPSLVPVDSTVLPVEHMFIYQNCRSWKRFIIILIIAALINAFVVEPFFSWTKMYRLYSWRYYYSVPLYVMKAIVARWVIELLLKSQQNASAHLRDPK